MADHDTPVSVDPEQVKSAQSLWSNFTVISKYSIIGICLILVLLAAAFVPW